MLGMGPFGYPADYLLWCALYASILGHTWCFFRFFPRQRFPRTGLIAGNLMVFFCLIGFVALAAESYIRFLTVRTDSFGMSLPARRWFALHARLNSMGCRDDEWPVEKPPGVRRIAFVGDSFTYGWGVERIEDRFSGRIAARFENQSPGRTHVMNVAKPGWDSLAQVAPIEDLIHRYAVDEIVLGYVCNDIEKVLPTTPDFNPTRPPEPRWFNPEGSCLVDSLFWTFYVPRCPSVRGYHDWLAEGYATESTWSRHCESLAAMTEFARAKGVVFKVVLLPFLRVGGTQFDRRRIHDQVAQYFSVNGVEVLDLLPIIANEPAERLVVNSRDAHPNAAAHELFAEAVWRAFYAKRNP